LDSLIEQVSAQLPDCVHAVPSMMSVDERRFLYGYAASAYRGEGLIIDGGIFLGASTMCFGHGIERNAMRDEILKIWPRPIRCFERGITGPQLKRYYAPGSRELPDIGESFAHIIRGNIESVAHLVDLRIGDILDQQTGSEPIEILFLDVLKAANIANFAVERFFGRLIPDRSIVVQQDYFYERLPYIKTMQESFSDSFAYVGEIASTGVFRCTAPIGLRQIEGFINRIPDGDEEFAFATRAMERTRDPVRKVMMAVSRLRIATHYRGPEEGRRMLADVEAMVAALEPKLQNKPAVLRSLGAARKVVTGTSPTGVGTVKPKAGRRVDATGQ